MREFGETDIIVRNCDKKKGDGYGDIELMTIK